jgi:hypothetical protein
MKKQNGFVFAVLWVAVFCMTQSARAGTLQVTRITTNYLGTMWYQWTGTSGAFKLNNTQFQGASNLHTNGGTVYNLVGAITYTPALISDFSSGGLAKGIFQAGSGITVTLKGAIKDLAGNSLYGTYTTPGTGQVILQATVWGNLARNDNDWNLIESTTDTGQFENIKLYLDLVNIGLANGITLTNGTILKIEQPEMDMTMAVTNQNPSNFNSMMPFVSGVPGGVIEFTAPIPEPATLVILSVGALFLRKQSK